jgi:zinc transport system substrate-binding protein
MNKYCIYITVLLFLASCSQPALNQSPAITVSIEPQRYFAEQLADTFFRVISMVAAGTSPETYDPSPEQMAQLSRSKAYFYAGHLGFETVWLEKLQKNNPELPFFNTGKGIEGTDPHIWSSPQEALIMVENMYHALVEIDSVHRIIYRSNFEKTTEAIRETDEIIRSYLKNSTQKAFLIYHPALTYFARDYGLTQYAIEADGKEPTADQIRQLVDTVKAHHIRTVFIQKEFDEKNAEVIAREIGARLVAINPLSYHWHEEMKTIAKALTDE